MKDSHLINYSLFCQRTKFNLYSFLKRSPDTTYEELCEFLRSRRVEPVSQETYLAYINKVLLEVVPESTQEEVVEVKVEKKPKTRRRRPRKKTNE
jgi:hypothetical protein